MNRVKPKRKNTGKKITTFKETTPLSTSAPAINPGAESTPVVTVQMPICVSPTAPTPRIFPAIVSLALAVESLTSLIRDVFSSYSGGYSALEPRHPLTFGPQLRQEYVPYPVLVHDHIDVRYISGQNVTGPGWC